MRWKWYRARRVGTPPIVVTPITAVDPNGVCGMRAALCQSNQCMSAAPAAGASTSPRAMPTNVLTNTRPPRVGITASV